MEEYIGGKNRQRLSFLSFLLMWDMGCYRDKSGWDIGESGWLENWKITEKPFMEGIMRHLIPLRWTKAIMLPFPVVLGGTIRSTDFPKTLQKKLAYFIFLFPWNSKEFMVKIRSLYRKYTCMEVYMRNMPV